MTTQFDYEGAVLESGDEEDMVMIMVLRRRAYTPPLCV